MKKSYLIALCALMLSACVAHGFSIGFGSGYPYGYYGRPGVSFGLGVGGYPYYGSYYRPYGYYYGGPGISFSLGSDRYDDDDYWDPETDSYYE